MNISGFITFRVFGFARRLHYRGIQIRRYPDTMFPLQVPDSKVSRLIFCVNGKMNQGPELSGFVMNPETFAPV